MTVLTDNCKNCGTPVSPDTLFFTDDLCPKCFRIKEVNFYKLCLDCESVTYRLGRDLGGLSEVVNHVVITYCNRKHHKTHPFKRACINLQEAVV